MNGERGCIAISELFHHHHHQRKALISIIFAFSILFIFIIFIFIVFIFTIFFSIFTMIIFFSPVCPLSVPQGCSCLLPLFSTCSHQSESPSMSFENIVWLASSTVSS